MGGFFGRAVQKHCTEKTREGCGGEKRRGKAAESSARGRFKDSETTQKQRVRKRQRGRVRERERREGGSVLYVNRPSSREM